MTQMARLKINWTGFSGAPGFTNLYFRDFSGTGNIDQAIVNGAITKTDTWLNAWNSRLPATVNVVIDPVVDVVEDTTGELVGFFTGTPFTRANGTGTGNYSAASGACVNWYTGAVVRGRRLRGRTFMVPLAGSALAVNGTIDDTALTALRSATTALINDAGAGDIGVWSRPTSATATDGQWAAVTSSTIPDKCAVLRSRRD